MVSCTSPNPPLRAQRVPAVAGSFFGPNRQFAAMQQDVCNGGQTGRSAVDARNAALDPKMDIGLPPLEVLKMTRYLFNCGARYFYHRPRPFGQAPVAESSITLSPVANGAPQWPILPLHNSR
jgi:hypothetical protein